MIPRNISRPIVLGFSLALIALGSIIPARTENAPVPQGANHIFTKAIASNTRARLTRSQLSNFSTRWIAVSA